jgi:transglutaminase-like putative cysteine protease
MRNSILKYLLLLPFILAFMSCLLRAEEDKYAVDKIPVGLISDADAVIRYDATRFEIDDESNTVEKDTFVVTIFNKDGQHYGDIFLHYDKFIDINDLNGRILDENGEEIRELDGDEIKDRPEISWYSLYEDSRVKEAELYYNKFPYTVEFTYEIDYDGYINWPSWYSQHSSEPVELSKFEVKVPDNYKLRYWCNKDSIKPEISEGGRLYSWHAENLPELSYDAVGESFIDIATVVKIAPSDFDLDGYKGNMTSWKEFGLWAYNLCKDKNNLSESVKKEIISLVSPYDSPKQKVIKLYKHLQSTTRYVSVQLGIGGWQPFDAMYVHDHGYGDCKALSNYMVSLLQTVGITSYSVWINNGSHRLPLINEFPSDQFNHVIVCIPLEKETVWLECTSQNRLAGNIGWTNENRQALMLTPEGGVIVSAPKSSFDQNIIQKKIEVVFSNSTASINGFIKWSGDEQNEVRGIIKEEVPKEQEKWILESFQVPDVKIKNYSFGINNDSTNQVNLKLNLTLPKYATISGSRIFFNPNLMERRTYVPKEVSERLSPVRFSYPYHDIDSIVYKIPQGYRVEAFPNEMNLSASFGSFSSRVSKNGDDKILYIRSLEVKDYEIPAGNYNEYRKFFSDVVKADRSQVVLVKDN